MPCGALAVWAVSSRHLCFMLLSSMKLRMLSFPRDSKLDIFGVAFWLLFGPVEAPCREGEDLYLLIFSFPTHGMSSGVKLGKVWP